MIVLFKNTINTKIALTLKEKTTLSAPYYLFELTNDTSNKAYYFISEDTSIYVDRYNLFTIEETEDEDPADGKITLGEPGFYSYKIYEQESATNLDPSLAGSVVEIGKCKLLTAPVTKKVYDKQVKERKVYAKS